jgi:hypothetical protein
MFHPNAFRFEDDPNAARFKPVEQSNIETLATRFNLDFCEDYLDGLLAGREDNGVINVATVVKKES